MRVKMQTRLGFERIKTTAVALLLIVYGLGMDIFISAVPGLEAIAPKYIWFFIFCATFPALALTTKVQKKIKSPLLFWLIAYNIISIAGLIYSKDNEWAYLAFINLCASNLILLPIWLAADSANRIPFWLCAIIFLMAIGSVVLDFFFPYQMFGIMTQGVDDRAAGFYLNPNQAGFAICFLELLLILKSPPRFVLTIILLGLIATLLTFSRGAYLLQVVLLLGLLWAGVLPREVRFVTMIAMFLAPFASLAVPLLASYLELSDSVGLYRLNLITGQEDFGMLASDDRFIIMISAIQSYLERPFVGGGLGYHLYWDQVGMGLGSTHNMTLRYMLDFGFIGLFIWAAFCLVIYIESRRAGHSKLALVICMLAFLASIFSHNLTELGLFLVPLYFSAKVAHQLQKSDKS